MTPEIEPTWEEVEQAIEELKEQGYSPYKVLRQEIDPPDERWISIQTESTDEDN